MQAATVHDAIVAFTVFVCGWALMAVEILGGRMLSPYFGADIYVWGSVIGVFMLALSSGYFLGGMLSKRIVSLHAFMALPAASGVWVAALPFWYRPLSLSLFDAGPRMGPLLASAALFLVPSVVLGMVSPYAIRLTARSVSTVGLRSGTLYAISTVGSFGGCITTAFWLIGFLGLRSILFVCGGSLCGVAFLGWMVGWISESRGDLQKNDRTV